MSLTINFPKRPPYRKHAPKISGSRSLRVWDNQKPRMSSCRIMSEVRRRLWIQVCAPETDVVAQRKLIHRIEGLTKRIDKRLVQEPLQAREIQTLNKLFETHVAYPGDQGANMGMCY